MIGLEMVERVAGRWGKESREKWEGKDGRSGDGGEIAMWKGDFCRILA